MPGDMADEAEHRKKQMMLDLLESMETLSDDYDEEVADAIRLAKEDPMPIERVRPLYARILKIIRPERSDEEIAAQVEEILSRQGRVPEGSE